MEAAFQLILQTSLYGVVVGLVILLAKKLLGQRLSGKWHYLLWTVLLIKLLFPFGPESAISLFNVVPVLPATLIFGTTPPATPVPITGPGEIGHRAPVVPPHGLPAQPEVSAAQNNVVPVVWLGGVLVLTAWLLLSSQLFKQKLRNSHCITDGRVAAVLGRAKGKMGVNANIGLLISDLVDTPSLFGLFNPRILLPKSACDLSGQELEYILLHELAHYKRKDVHVNCLLLALQAVHWFNPVMWYLFRRVRQDMELATDELVLATLESTEHKAYGRALLNVLERFAEPKLSGKLLYMADDRKNIERRINMIKMADLFRKKRRAVLAAGMLCVAVLGVVLLTNAVPRGNAETKAELIEVYKAPYTGQEAILLFVLDMQSEMRVVTDAIQNSVKIQGILDVILADYEVRIIREEQVEVTVLLWLSGDSEKAMIMYPDDTHTGYTVTKKDTLALMEVFSARAAAVGDSSPQRDDEPIEVYSGMAATLEGFEPLFVLTQTEGIDILTEAIQNSVRINGVGDGVLKVKEPDYSLKMPPILPTAMYLSSDSRHYPIRDEGRVIMYLWLDGENGMIMYHSETHTGYALSSADTSALKALFGLRP